MWTRARAAGDTWRRQSRGLALASAARGYAVTADQVETFERDGAVVLRSLLSADELVALEEAIEWNMAHPGPLAGVASAADDPGRFFEDFCNWRRIPAYKCLAFHSALPRAAAALMRSDTVRLHHDHVLVKEARTRQPTPWHQDLPYYNIRGQQTVSFWIPVDPVQRESTLELVQLTAASDCYPSPCP
jgi:ectoine hydroxylase-related dioxygenase (phytanoyl-CoA dioxygenase family)